jgi:hypothetical protein
MPPAKSRAPSSRDVYDDPYERAEAGERPAALDRPRMDVEDEEDGGEEKPLIGAPSPNGGL